ncbi:MAG: DNA-3-methyladenine glycosylase [Promethearchaeota archaeon]|jgi:DNA-3-methyladenine glycosylase
MNSNSRLARDFFKKDTVTVAKELIGKHLVRKTKWGNLIGKITEVEAYLGPTDKACHTYNYKKTKRTKTMYKEPGTLYIYLIYGMYHCLNVITEPKGIPCAVLIRRLYPIDGIEQMLQYRKVKRLGKNFKDLVDGPGKLCIALNITKDEFNGIDSCSRDSKVFFTSGQIKSDERITLSKRIGIDYAEEDKDRLLRFTLTNNKLS